MSGRFNGKVVLVTGAASGIGRESALAFGREGASVIVSDISEGDGISVAGEIAAAGGEATFVRADVSVAEEVESLVRQTVAAYGGLDVAHNNAGIGGTYAPTESYPEKDFDRVISVNLKSVWLCMRAEIPAMLERGGGAIVNTASAAGLVGLAYNTAYTAAKHGVVGLTKAAAQEYAKKNIRINAVCPGFVETPMVTETLTDYSRDALVKAHPIGRLGAAGEVVGAVMWLASDTEAAFVTGTTVSVDGGLTSR
ncbi:SDR family NAD(P)-dependent oxidoreductase [Rubrobacter indicoceani]|uniref:SDR family NAD(P)-dependent oxidoreductase n=1 Tax=Rubrobacter indicoceani TaxID=2051957 RepID=UPI000E5B2CDF|nr:glucose 1-dehydrogenase [Rubrobacter indicoceani]